MRPFTLPPGWRMDADACHAEWLDRFGNRDWADDIAHPQGTVLPDGFPAYTALLHPLSDDGDTRWLPSVLDDPWVRITDVQEHGFDGDRWAADIPPESDLTRLFAAAVPVATSGCDLVIGLLFGVPGGSDTYTLTPTAADDYLREPRHAVHWGVYGLTLWFPADHSWCAAAPYDQGITYLASDTHLADRLLGHPTSRRCHAADRFHRWARGRRGGDEQRPVVSRVRAAERGRRRRLRRCPGRVVGADVEPAR